MSTPGKLTARREAEAAAAAAQVVAVRRAFKGIVGRPSKTGARAGSLARRDDTARRDRLAQLDSRTVKTSRGKTKLVTGAAALTELHRLEGKDAS